MAKYYAVKVGKTTGIFNSWDECKESVSGYSGAVYKSFKDIREACQYMGWEDSENLSSTKTDKSPSNQNVSGQNLSVKNGTIDDSFDISSANNSATYAYVDGSFNQFTGVYAYGVVMFYDKQELHFSGNDSKPDMASMRNVSGEIEGAMCAMRFALEHNCPAITIYHDYEGIARWPLGQWKANKSGTIAYKEFYDSIKDKLQVTFVHVKGHSGDKYNDLADSLAKKAAGIE